MPIKRRLRQLAQYGFWLYSLALLVILLFHYVTPWFAFLDSWPLLRAATVYVLFIVPVAGATYLFGQRGGLATLIAAVLIMLSRVRYASANRVDVLLAAISSSLVGYLAVLILACLL